MGSNSSRERIGEQESIHPLDYSPFNHNNCGAQLLALGQSTPSGPNVASVGPPPNLVRAVNTICENCSAQRRECGIGEVCALCGHVQTQHS